MTAPLWTAADAAKATGGRVAGDWEANGISIDSRTVRRAICSWRCRPRGTGMISSPMRWTRAPWPLVSRVPEGVDPARLLIVPDVLEGLADLGRAARARTSAKVIAVTGSVGKTTVKEMLRVTLGAQGRPMRRRPVSTTTGACP
jgi:UDP-N-acetylmuramoyl-tripeptide--D-alanyl-D-alanine ligase